MKRWYVLNVEPNQDGHALLWLQRRGFEALSLKIYVWRTGRRVKDTIELLFPGYLLIQLPPATTRWPDILRSPHVIGALPIGREPMPLPEREIAELLRNVDSTGLVNPHDVRRRREARSYKPGQAMRIMDGPATGLIGRFVARSAADRIKLLLDLLGGQRVVEISESRVETVDA